MIEFRPFFSTVMQQAVAASPAKRLNKAQRNEQIQSENKTSHTKPVTLKESKRF